MVFRVHNRTVSAGSAFAPRPCFSISHNPARSTKVSGSAALSGDSPSANVLREQASKKAQQILNTKTFPIPRLRLPGGTGWVFF